MAIYTNYGRYLKAKQFKDNLESAGDTYMVLGIGDPAWDTNRLSMPIAPYNASIVTNGDIDSNQFFDNKVCQYVLSDSLTKTLVDGGDIQNGSWVQNYKNLVPAFPCLWKSQSDDEVLFTIDSESIKKNEYHRYYIKSSDTLYTLYKVTGTTSTAVVSNFDYSILTNDISREYFAELYLRGLRVEKWLSVPGLIGAIKCKIEFVKDIGFTDANYTGAINQLYYGDRYWETVQDSDIASYYNEYTKDHGEDKNYPTHLLISALINPGYLINNLNIDQNLCARQIAIYTSERSDDEETNPIYYRAGEYLFNFGQYCKQKNALTSEWEWVPRYGYGHPVAEADVNKVLDFTIPFNIDDDKIYPLSEESKKFNFVLHDYILGNRRDKHSADRISYVIGF